MEFIFEILFEFIIQIVVEVFIGATVHLVSAVFNRFSGPWLAALGCAAVGALLGGASLWMFPHHMVASGTGRIVNLIVTPIGVGLCMSLIGAWLEARGKTALRLDHFSFGYLFALCFAVVRFVWAA